MVLFLTSSEFVVETEFSYKKWHINVENFAKNIQVSFEVNTMEYSVLNKHTWPHQSLIHLSLLLKFFLSATLQLLSTSFSVHLIIRSISQSHVSTGPSKRVG